MEKQKVDKLKKRLEKRPVMSNCYLITLADRKGDQLEIISSVQLRWPYYEKHPLKVVGIAADYDEAVAIVIHLTEKCMEKRGDCNLKEYLLCLES